MTSANVNICTEKNYLLSLVGTPVFIKSFNLPAGYFPIPAGFYFIDAVIFHFDGSVELGVSEYDPSIPIDQFDIDAAHISYFNVKDLQIITDSKQTDITTLNNPKAA